MVLIELDGDGALLCSRKGGYLSRRHVSGVLHDARPNNIHLDGQRPCSLVDSSGFAIARLINALGCHRKMQCI